MVSLSEGRGGHSVSLSVSFVQIQDETYCERIFYFSIFRVAVNFRFFKFKFRPSQYEYTIVLLPYDFLH